MAGEINSIPAGKMPSTIDQTADFAKGLGLSDKATETIKNIAALLGGRNVSVNTNPRADGAETGRPTGSTGVPALDNPADIKQLEQNLEKLLSYIQMDNEERQTAMAKDRIDMQKDALDAERNNRSEKIEKSLKDMDKAAESRKASKIFGWLMTALAVVAAVVACVATGGLAVGPVIGAAIAIGCQVLNETGVMDKIVEKLAKGLEGMGLSKQASQILAQVLITVAIMAASLGAGLAGGGASAVSSVAKGIADTAKGLKVTVETMEKIRAAVALTMTIVGIGSAEHTTPSRLGCRRPTSRRPRSTSPRSSSASTSARRNSTRSSRCSSRRSRRWRRCFRPRQTRRLRSRTTWARWRKLEV